MGKCINVVDYEKIYRTGYVCPIKDIHHAGQGFELNTLRPRSYGDYDIDRERTIMPNENALLRASCCYMNVLLGIENKIEKGVFQVQNGEKRTPYNTKIVTYLLYYAIASHGIPADEVKTTVNRRWLQQYKLDDYIDKYCVLPIEATSSAGKDVNADITYMLSQTMPNYVRYDPSEALENIISVHGVFDEDTHRFLGFQKNQIARLFIWNDSMPTIKAHQMHFVARYLLNRLIIPMYPNMKTMYMEFANRTAINKVLKKARLEVYAKSSYDSPLQFLFAHRTPAERQAEQEYFDEAFKIYKEKELKYISRRRKAAI